jgi:hypothetical protein
MAARELQPRPRVRLPHGALVRARIDDEHVRDVRRVELVVELHVLLPEALVAGPHVERKERLSSRAIEDADERMRARAGLALLGISLAGGSAGGRPGSAAAVAAWLGASCAIAATAAGPAASVLAPGAGLGVAAGVLYAAGDVSSKTAVHGGVTLLFVPAVLAAHGLAFMALQLSFQRGGPLATIGVSTLLTNALPIAAGLTIYGETLPGGALGFFRAIAFVLVVAGAGALATRGRGQEERPRRLSRWTPSTSSSPSSRTEIAPTAGTGATHA